MLLAKLVKFTLSFHLSKAQIMTKLKNLFLRVMSWFLRLTGRYLEIVEKNMTRLMWNLLEQKSNYLMGGSDHTKLRQLLLIKEFKRCLNSDVKALLFGPLRSAEVF